MRGLISRDFYTKPVLELKMAHLQQKHNPESQSTEGPLLSLAQIRLRSYVELYLLLGYCSCLEGNRRGNSCRRHGNSHS